MGKRRSKDRQQKAAKSGTHNSGKVQLNPAQCYRRGKLLFVDDVRNNRAQNWRAESQPNAEREDAAEHCARVDRSRPRAKGKKRGAGSLPQQGNRTKARRLTMSATAPAGSVKRKNGAEAAVAMSESERDEAPRSCINHVADMSCAERNVPDKTLASHIRQKTGFRSANQVEADFTSVREREIRPPNGVNRQASGIFEPKSSETVPACAFP